MSEANQGNPGFSPTFKLISPQAFFSTITTWMEERTTKEPPAIEPGSPLAGDGAKSPEHQVGHAAWSGISLAVDHLHAIKVQVIDAQVLHPYSPYTLMRAAIENAATAVWLLEPNDRNERLQRRLKLAHHEAFEAGKARELLPAAFAGL